MAVQIPGIAELYKLPEVAGRLDVLNAQGVQSQNALRNLTVQQGQQEMQMQNAMKQIAGMPGMRDEHGLPTPQFINALGAISPAMANKAALEVSQIRHNNSLVEQEKQRIKDMQDKAKLAYLPEVLNIFTNMKNEHDQLVSAGNPDARQLAVAKGMAALDQAQRIGLVGNHGNDIKADITAFDPERAPVLIKDMRALIARGKDEGGEVMVDPANGNRFLVNKQGDVKMWGADAVTGKYGYQPYAGTMPVVHKLGTRDPLSPEDFAARAEAVTRARTAAAADDQVPLTDDTLRMDAYGYLFDRKLPTNMGRGVQGSQQATKIRNEASRIAKDELKMDMDEIALMAATNKTQMMAIAQLGRARAGIGQLEKTAEANADLALKASNAATRSGIPVLNKGVQWAQENLAGDETLRQFTIANETFISEYAKVMSGGYGAAASTEGAQNRAHQLLNRAATQKEYEAGVSQLKLEMRNRMKSLDRQMDEERGRLRGVGKTPDSSGSGVPQVGEVRQGFRFKGGNPGDKTNWEVVP